MEGCTEDTLIVVDESKGAVSNLKSSPRAATGEAAKASSRGQQPGGKGSRAASPAVSGLSTPTFALVPGSASGGGAWHRPAAFISGRDIRVRGDLYDADSEDEAFVEEVVAGRVRTSSDVVAFMRRRSAGALGPDTTARARTGGSTSAAARGKAAGKSGLKPVPTAARASGASATPVRPRSGAATADGSPGATKASHNHNRGEASVDGDVAGVSVNALETAFQVLECEAYIAAVAAETSRLEHHVQRMQWLLTQRVKGVFSLYTELVTRQDGLGEGKSSSHRPRATTPAAPPKSHHHSRAAASHSDDYPLSTIMAIGRSGSAAPFDGFVSAALISPRRGGASTPRAASASIASGSAGAHSAATASGASVTGVRGRPGQQPPRSLTPSRIRVDSVDAPSPPRDAPSSSAPSVSSAHMLTSAAASEAVRGALVGSNEASATLTAFIPLLCDYWLLKREAEHGALLRCFHNVGSGDIPSDASVSVLTRVVGEGELAPLPRPSRAKRRGAGGGGGDDDASLASSEEEEVEGESDEAGGGGRLSNVTMKRLSSVRSRVRDAEGNARALMRIRRLRQQLERFRIIIDLTRKREKLKRDRQKVIGTMLQSVVLAADAMATNHAAKRLRRGSSAPSLATSASSGTGASGGASASSKGSGLAASFEWEDAALRTRHGSFTSLSSRRVAHASLPLPPAWRHALRTASSVHDLIATGNEFALAPTSLPAPPREPVPTTPHARGQVERAHMHVATPQGGNESGDTSATAGSHLWSVGSREKAMPGTQHSIDASSGRSCTLQ